MEHSEEELRGANDVRLHLALHRPSNVSTPRAVVAVSHGFGEHGGRYSNLVEHIVPRGYAVYALDHQGHGRSGGRRGHVGRWSEYLAGVGAMLEAVRQREPGAPVFLFGHSLGGLIAAEYALAHPEGLAGLILSSPVLGSVGVSPARRMLGRALSGVWPTFSIHTGLDAGTISRDPAAVRGYIADPLVHDVASARLGSEMDLAVKRVQARAAEFALPLLLFHGTADRLTSPEARRAFFARTTAPDREFVEYDGGYHETLNDLDHERVAADVLRWMEARLPRTDHCEER